MEKKYMDLHMHTIYSDGTCQPEDVVKFNALRGLDVIAICDHDNMRAYERAKVEAEKWGITVIPGAELTTERYHILALGFDVEDREFQKYLKYSEDLQNRNTKLRVEALAAHGIPITYEKVKEYFPDARLGKANFGMALVRDPECREYILNTIGKQNAIDLMRRFMKKGGIAGNIDRRNAGEEETIRAIKKAGGIAIIAHPSKDVESLTELDELRFYGLDGLEVQPRFIETYPRFIEYAGKHGLLMTYGSDFHGPEFGARPLLGRDGNVMSKELIQRLF